MPVCVRAGIILEQDDEGTTFAPESSRTRTVEAPGGNPLIFYNFVQDRKFAAFCGATPGPGHPFNRNMFVKLLKLRNDAVSRCMLKQQHDDDPSLCGGAMEESGEDERSLKKLPRLELRMACQRF